MFDMLVHGNMLTMVDKRITKDKTSTSQNRLLTSKIVGDLSASTTCRRQLLWCCDHWLKMMLYIWSWIPFFKGEPCPRKGQTLNYMCRSGKPLCRKMQETVSWHSDTVYHNQVIRILLECAVDCMVYLEEVKTQSTIIHTCGIPWEDIVASL